jgi:hypothetical protein
LIRARGCAGGPRGDVFHGQDLPARFHELGGAAVPGRLGDEGGDHRDGLGGDGDGVSSCTAQAAGILRQMHQETEGWRRVLP